MKIQIDIKEEIISDLFIDCIEGGYSDWLGKCKVMDGKKYGEGEAWYLGMSCKYDGPKSEEGTFKEHKIITNSFIKNGLTLLAKNSPACFGRILAEDSDAIDADMSS